MPMSMVAWTRGCAWALLFALAGCASGLDRGNALQQRQYDYSAAVRWGDMEGAWGMVDPAYRQAHPMSAVEFERYAQVQVSGYTDVGSEVAADGLSARREIQISAINRHTMTERGLRYAERWRYDAASKTWWVTSGLPDFWAGK